MPADREIQPGLLDATGAMMLNAAAATAYDTDRVLKSIPPEREVEIPIQITECDSSQTPPRCAWRERAWQADGTRYDKPNGRSGTTTFRPALLIGNGAAPPSDMPFDTWGRLTVVADTLEQVLEVDWNCACAAGGSGFSSGGGGTSVITDDCGTLSTVLSLTLTDAGAASGLDGTVIDAEWDGSEWTATGVALRDSVTDWSAACVAGVLNWTWTETSNTGTARFQQDGVSGGGSFGTVPPPAGAPVTFGVAGEPTVQLIAFVTEG
jgi:hypothetical protein